MARKIGKVKRGKKTLVWVDSQGNVWEKPIKKGKGKGKGKRKRKR